MTDSSAFQRPNLVFYIGIWFAFIAGAGELASLGFRIVVRREIILVGPDAIWTVPLLYAIGFSVPSIGLWAMARRWPRLGSVRVVVFVFAFIDSFIWLLMIPGLILYARVLLAGGIAFQAAAILAAHPRLLFSGMRYTLGWAGAFARRASPAGTDTDSTSIPDTLLDRRQFLTSSVLTLAGLAAGVRGWGWLAERQALAKLTQPPARRPNVLLIVLDTVRSQNLSLYGYARPTSPFLAQLAAGGVLFDQAIPTASWTLASHASMFTGRYPHELSTGWTTPLDSTYPTLAEALAANGYRTGGFVANTDYCSYRHGLNRGFTHYEDFTVSAGRAVLDSVLGREFIDTRQFRETLHLYQTLGRKSATQVNGELLAWLADADRRPFFGFLNYYDSHNPYLPPEPFAGKFAVGEPLGYFAPGREVPGPDVPRLADAYDGTLAYLDDTLRALLDELEIRGALEDTLVIITSDHGEQFGEHGLMQHGNSLYRQLIQVPLLFIFPAAIPSGQRVKTPVTLRDLPATILDVTGAGSLSQFPGQTLARFWTDSAEAASPASPLLSKVPRYWGPATRYPNSTGEISSLITNDLHYIQCAENGREELYSWTDDLEETQNLAQTAAGRAALAPLRKQLDQLLGKT